MNVSNATMQALAGNMNDTAGRADTARGRYLRMRAVVEPSVALLLLLLVAPILAVAMALIVMTSSGPAVYRQTRVGLAGRKFTIFKLRSMTEDAESVTGAVWSQPGDPRVTSIGRALRRSHLDELPQLVNVIRGEMSLIGPRPERPEFVSQLATRIPDYANRHQVLPGITGLAQITYPADDDVDSVRRKIGEDERYIRNVGLLMDMKILLYTVAVLAGIRRNPSEGRRAGACTPASAKPSSRGRKSALKGLEGVMLLLMATLANGPAYAGLLSVGDLISDSPGQSQIITDTRNNREWLRFSVLGPRQLRYTDVLDITAPGGEFEDWNIATEVEALQLVAAILSSESHNCNGATLSGQICGVLGVRDDYHNLLGRPRHHQAFYVWQGKGAGVFQIFDFSNFPGTEVALINGARTLPTAHQYRTSMPWLLFRDSAAAPAPQALALVSLGLAGGVFATCLRRPRRRNENRIR